MRYLLVGESKSANLGDSIICNLSLKFFSSLCDGKIVVFDISCARHTLIGKIFRKVDTLIGTDLFTGYTFAYVYVKSLLLLDKRTVLVFVGGAIFMDYFLDSINALLALAIRKKVPVRFHSCGTGKMSALKKQKLLQRLSLVDLNCFTLRDGLCLFNSVIDVKQVPDIAICTDEFYAASPKKEKCLGWGVIDVNAYNLNYPEDKISLDKYLKMSEVAIRMIISIGYNVEIFTNGSPEDYAVAEKLLIHLNDTNVVLVNRPMNDREIVSIISRYNLIVASRLHALILSYSYKIPFIGIVWNYKIREFLNLIGYSERAYEMKNFHKLDWKSILLSIEKVGVVKDKRLVSLVHQQIHDAIFL